MTEPKLSKAKLMILWRVACNEIPDDWNVKMWDEKTTIYWMLDNLYIGCDVDCDFWFLDKKGKQVLKQVIFPH